MGLNTTGVQVWQYCPTSKCLEAAHGTDASLCCSVQPPGPLSPPTAAPCWHDFPAFPPLLRHASCCFPPPALAQPGLTLSSPHCATLPQPLGQGLEVTTTGGKGSSRDSGCYCSWSNWGSSSWVSGTVLK